MSCLSSFFSSYHYFNSNVSQYNIPEQPIPTGILFLMDLKNLEIYITEIRHQAHIRRDPWEIFGSISPNLPQACRK